jgi:hypothetical protein
MKKRWKRALRTGGIVLASAPILVTGFSLYVYFHKPALKSYIETTLSKEPGLTVTIGRLNYRVFPLRVEADSVKVVFVNVLGRAGSLTAFLRRAIIPDLWPENEKNHGSPVRPDLRGAQSLLLFCRRLLPRAQSHARGDVFPLSRLRDVDLSLFLEQPFLSRGV